MLDVLLRSLRDGLRFPVPADVNVLEPSLRLAYGGREPLRAIQCREVA
ncbi:MAG TPA: hypothetical protein VHC92_13045 [Rhodanobacteraceae bacterium]|nr:hypothetical protein [Rhodanobacteraceae bacterium]